ncbi:hypothetical protein [Gloeomargarita lithophora]|uniref:hypothetical protein n=1 Tax=Gloeomargarita lithophora TaxID=1188228 RepID=UPI0008F8126C|nr:hypothetical protein [Gloeomargarita lithophora]
MAGWLMYFKAQGQRLALQNRYIFLDFAAFMLILEKNLKLSGCNVCHFSALVVWKWGCVFWI